MRLLQRIDPSRLFDSDVRSHDLKAKSMRGGLSTMGGQATKTLVQILGVAVLARLLTPEDYGVVGMAMVVIGFAQIFKDAGLSAATVQAKEISHPQVSTLFWANIIVSLILAAVITASAPLVGRFYDRPELVAVLAALSLVFILGGITVQHQALLRRQMLFSAVAMAGVVGQVANYATAVIAALMGAGYWALVIGALVGELVSAAWILISCPWVPSKPTRGAGSRTLLRIGGDMMAFNTLDYFAGNTDNILIGRFLGATPLGLYGKAYSLFKLPVSQIRHPMSAVALPALSALREQPERYAAYYRRFVETLALLTIPLAVYSMVEAEFIIRLLLGEQWMGVVTVFRLLAIGGIIEAVASTRGMILISCGLSREYVKLGAANAAVRVLAVVIGLQFGIEGVAGASALGIMAFFVPSLHLFTKLTPVTPSDFYRAMWRPLGFSALAAAVWLLVKVPLPDSQIWVGFVGVMAFFGGYFALAMANADLRADLKMAMQTLGMKR